MNVLEAIQDLSQPVVSSRAAAAALDPKAVALADDMHIRDMGDAPGACPGGEGIDCLEILRLIHGSIGNAPGERANRQIAGDDHDGIGQRGSNQHLRARQIGQHARPARVRPGERHDPQRKRAQKDARADRADGS